MGFWLWWSKKAGKSYPHKTSTQVDQIVKNNHFSALDIEQRQTANWVVFTHKTLLEVPVRKVDVLPFLCEAAPIPLYPAPLALRTAKILSTKWLHPNPCTKKLDPTLTWLLGAYGHVPRMTQNDCLRKLAIINPSSAFLRCTDTSSTIQNCLLKGLGAVPSKHRHSEK